MSSQTFTSSSTWTAPAGITQVQAECWGGGGGGGSGTIGFHGGGGGGGGAYSQKLVIAVIPGNTYTVTVGTAGAGSSSAGTDGTNGNDSWFSTSGTVLAKGGLGGGGGTASVVGPGGAGGDSASGIGDNLFSGGSGDSAFLLPSGGGGSSAGTAGNGNPGIAYVGGAAPAGGGAGGDGARITGSVAGHAPGGGGGGGASSTGLIASRNGAAGQVILTWNFPPAIPSLAPVLADDPLIDPPPFLFGLLPSMVLSPSPVMPVRFVFEPAVEEEVIPFMIAPRFIDYSLRWADVRGLYRIFNASGYRFYRSSSRPPIPGDAPFATNTTLPFQPSATYPDGTWYVSVSYFDGVLDSGLLPLGKHGETYLSIEISGGARLPARPAAPLGPMLKVLAGGVIQIVAYYPRVSDGINAATAWAIAYTTDGSTPASNAPTLTPAMPAGSIAFLQFSLPAQADGTTVKVQIQTRRIDGGPVTVYSLPAAVLTATADASGPTVALDLKSWPGDIAE